MNTIPSLKEIIERAERHLDVFELARLVAALALGLQHGGGASWPTPDEEDKE